MGKKEQLDSYAWYDPANDCIYVRVRKWKLDSQSKPHKVGVVCKITEEAFKATVEGTEYMHSLPDSIKKWKEPIEKTNRWELISEDIDEEEDKI